MNFDYTNYREEAQRQVRKRNRTLNFILIAISVIAPLAFFIFTAYETNQLGLELLGQERYSARMNDSYLFAIIIFAIVFIFIVLPAILLLKHYFESYLSVITKLSPHDLKTYKTINEQLPFIEKHMPSFIIKDQSIIFFQLLKQTQIDFREMKILDVIRTYGRYAGFVIKIKTNHGTYRFKISTNRLQMETLVLNAATSNPDLVITKS